MSDEKTKPQKGGNGGFIAGMLTATIILSVVVWVAEYQKWIYISATKPASAAPYPTPEQQVAKVSDGKSDRQNGSDVVGSVADTSIWDGLVSLDDVVQSGNEIGISKRAASLSKDSNKPKARFYRFINNKGKRDMGIDLTGVPRDQINPLTGEIPLQDGHPTHFRMGHVGPKP